MEKVHLIENVGIPFEILDTHQRSFRFEIGNLCLDLFN